MVDDVVAHGATIPSAPWPSRVQSPCRRPSAPSASSSPSRCASTATTSGRAWRSVSRPPSSQSSSERTSRGDRAHPCADALRRAAQRHRSSTRASLVLETRPSCAASVVAWLAGWLVFAPVPFLVLAYVLPGLVWLAALGARRPGPRRRAACRSARRSAARGGSRAPTSSTRSGSLFTLAVLVVLTQSVLVFVLRGFGDAAQSAALFLASVVLSPLLFVGTALLYVDQAARVE